MFVDLDGSGFPSLLMTWNPHLAKVILSVLVLVVHFEIHGRFNTVVPIPGLYNLFSHPALAAMAQ